MVVAGSCKRSNRQHKTWELNARGMNAALVQTSLGRHRVHSGAMILTAP